MKLRLTLDLNENERDKLKKLIGKRTNVHFDEYRKVISDLVKESLNDLNEKEHHIKKVNV